MEKSIFEKVSFKPVLFFCIFLMAMDIWRIATFMVNKDIQPMPFISISAGLLLMTMVLFISYRKQEKIAIGLLSISLIVDWLGDIRFMSIPLSSSISILFEIGTAYFYWLSYKAVKSNRITIGKNPKLLISITLLLLILAIPALFFWIIGMLSNILK